MPNCPACAEPTAADYRVCPNCGVRLQEFATTAAPASPKGAGGGTGMLVGILAGVCGVLLVCGGILAALLVPAVQAAREAAKRSACQNNLRQIGVALHSYHDRYGAFPPAYVADEHGRPLYSWRVLILPFVDSSGLYERFDKSQAWDSPANLPLLNSMPPIYHCPSHGQPGDTNTAYAAIVGPECVFTGPASTTFDQISDGLSNTWIVGEATEAAIPWTKPADLPLSGFGGINMPGGFTSRHRLGANVLIADGSVRFASSTMSAEAIKALSTRDGRDVNREF